MYDMIEAFRMIFRNHRKELKPCPFCGAKAEAQFRRDLKTWVVQCSNENCPASYMIGNRYDSLDEAARVWNRRSI